MGFYDSTAHQAVFEGILLTTCILSCLVSIVMILLLRAMKVQNGHLLIVSCITWSQFVYDISFYPAMTATPPAFAAQFIFILLQLMSGISVSLFSNAMALITLYVITCKRSFSVHRYFKQMCATVGIAIAVVVVLFSMSASSSSYVYLGTIS